MTLATPTTDNWQATRDTMNGYAKVIGKIRRALTPHQKHWWHVSLRATARGLSTTPVRVNGVSAEIELDFGTHTAIASTSDGRMCRIPLAGQAARTLYRNLRDFLSKLGADLDIDEEQFGSDITRYDAAVASHLWGIFAEVDWLIKSFRNTFRHESSPVQLWPHHFDIAVLWFSGNLIDGQDPDNEEWADEQMNFGFVLGDDLIAEPYFYITAYPTPAGLTDTELPGKAYWLTDGFTGAILKLADVDSAEDISNFFTHVHQAGKQLMIGK